MRKMRPAIRQCHPRRNGRRASLSGVAVLAAAAAALSLGGCSVPVADLPVIGLPSGAPARPAESAAYPAVHDIPSARTDPTLSADEQSKVEDDLKAARARQAGQAKAAERPN